MLEKHEKEILLVKEQITGYQNMEIVLNKKARGDENLH